ncbi:sensor histidine kinase [Dactylosporangium sp. NPDC049742]|uniref:sensor histidine kinase n=1 Tax=Dactylosporangium sp. NPDC049742 TaxID=3154737 RepID=UPI00341D565B
MRKSMPGSTPADRFGGLSTPVVDALFASGVTVATCLAGLAYQPADWRPFDGLAALMGCLTCLPLAARRRWPMSALLATCAGYTGYLQLGYPPSLLWWGPVLGLYTVVVLRPGRWAVAGSVVTAAVVGFSGVKAPALPPLVVVIQPLLVLAGVWVLGGGARALADRNRQLAVLTARLRQEQRDRARHAVAEERVRIARELHDVVAHHMSVISVQVGLARYVFASDPPTARTALDTIAGAGREAQQEMRRLLMVLRVGADEEDAGRFGALVPGLARIGDLVDRVRATGLPVEVEVRTADPVPPLPAHLDLCVYRVIQESLTNVLKHAGPATATVTVEHRPGAVSARIVDDGRGVVEQSWPEPGYGLLGMRERVRLYGGTLSTGPRPEGGYMVQLTLPVPVRS